MNINTNLSSLITQSSLKRSTLKLNEAIERMTTGCKINHAKDNAANYGIVTNLSSRISSLEVAEDNALMAYDLLSTADSAFELVNSHLRRIRDLAETAANETYSANSRAALQAEINARLDEIYRIFDTTEYNNQHLFNLAQDYGINLLSASTEKPANETTTLNQLGIPSSSFSVYDSSNTLVNEYTINADDTLGKFLNVLKTEGFTTQILDGQISISSSSGKYISGPLANCLGITTTTTTTIESSSQSSTLAITGTSTTTADASTTFAELGIADGTFVVKNASNTSIKTITVKTTDTLGDFFTSLSQNSITASMTDGVISLSSASGYSIVGDLADKLGIKQNYATVTTSVTQTGSVEKILHDVYDNRYYNDSQLPKQVSTGNFIETISRIDTSTLTSLASAVNDNFEIEAGRYSISTKEELAMLSKIKRVAGGSLDFVLANDIDLSGIDWDPIDTSEITAFFGNGYAITNLTSTKGGLFGTCRATVFDLGLLNVNIETDDSIYYLGGLANKATSSINNCFVEGYISGGKVTGGLVGNSSDIHDSYADVTVKGYGDIGGLAGEASSSVVNCYSKGSLYNINDQPSSLDRIGGICGMMRYGSISQAYSSCSISSENVNNDDIGGIIGYFKGSCMKYVTFEGSLPDDYGSSSIGAIVGSCYIQNRNDVSYMVGSSSRPNIAYLKISETNLSDNLDSLAISSGNVIIRNPDGSSQTISVSSSSTLSELSAQLSTYGFQVSLSSGKLNIVSENGSYLESVSGGSNLPSKLTKSVKTKTCYVNTTSNSLDYTALTTINLATTLGELSGYSNGNGKLGINLANGSKATIQINSTDTINDLFNKISTYGITGSIVDGKVTFQAAENAYLEPISGGSQLLSCLNLGNINKTETVCNKNTLSNKLTYVDNSVSPDPSPDPKPDKPSRPSAQPDFDFGCIGGNPDDSISIDLGFDFDLSVDVSTAKNVQEALEEIDSAIKQINEKQTQIGSVSNRFLSVLEEISIQQENLVSSRSTLRDADIAEVSSDYIKWQILQQASATLLSTANQTPATALGLL